MNIKLEESTIVVERGIASHLSDYFYSANKIMIISDTQVPKIYKTTVVIEFAPPIYPNVLDKEAKKNLSDTVVSTIKAMYEKNKTLPTH